MDSLYRRILVIEDDAAIRNVLCVLGSRLGCKLETACSEPDLMAKLTAGKFDAVLLDLRCANLHPERVIPQIQNVCPSLIGRVLVITGDVADEKTLKLIEEHFLLELPWTRMMEDFQGRLRALLCIPPSSVVAR